MTNELTKDIPVGDIQFYDDYLPALEAGNWKIQVDHTVEKDGAPVNKNSDGQTIPLGAVQEFVVSAPQFSIPPAEIMNQYPPAGSTGLYGEVLPHIVLSDPLLPWERNINSPGSREPWLALLVFGADELVGAEQAPTRTTATTVADFLKAQAGVVKPSITKEADVADSDPCSYIQIKVADFQKITPRLQELRYLSHCRQINTDDKAILGINEHGLFSVVVANRFPAAPAAASDPPANSIVHLVSVEGLESYLVENPDFGSNTTVALLSLASWTFQTLPDKDQDFAGLVENIVKQQLKTDSDPPSICSGVDPGKSCPEKSWLRLPQLALPEDAAGSAAAKRLADGFVPIAYHTRTGEETFAWYRGPLTPLFTTQLQAPDPYLTGDAALIYDKELGVFDTSLSAAWQIGRAVALSDKSFGQQLMSFRRAGHQITDNLLQRLQSDYFSQDQIDQLEYDSAVQDEFLQVLNTQLLQDIGKSAETSGTLPPAPTEGKTDPKAEVQNFLAQPEVQAKLTELVKTDLDPVANWLAQLMLLYPVPFAYLVPDERMLPIESLRFFYLDRNWLSALLDGALSIAMESSRQTFFHEMTHGLLHESAVAAAKAYRDKLRGVEPGTAEVQESLVCGFLLRSALVSGWPNLAVRPRQNGSDDLLKILRLDHLSPSVLLCLVEGVPDYFEFSEPQESFRFGVDDDGKIPLRNLVPPSKTSDPPLGVQLPGDPLFQVRDLSGQQQLYMRAAGSRVLNIAPDSPTALIQKLTEANAAASKADLRTLSPGEFALQMVKSPEAIKFLSQGQLET